MKKPSTRTLIVAATSLVLMAGLGVAAVAVAGGLPGHGGPFGHGGPAAHFMMEQIIEDLELTAEQQQYLDNVHRIIDDHRTANADERREHVESVRAGIAEGNVSLTEVQASIDGHLEEGRVVARAVSEELVALVNSLDESQRATLLTKMDRLHAFMDHHRPAGAGLAEDAR